MNHLSHLDELSICLRLSCCRQDQTCFWAKAQVFNKWKVYIKSGSGRPEGFFFLLKRIASERLRYGSFSSIFHKPKIRKVYWHLTYLTGEGNGTPLQYSCLENPMDGGAWWAAVHGVAEGRTRLSDFTFTFHFHALEKEMATHSSVLAWRIPGMGEPRGLSLGSHRVGHDWSDSAAAAAAATYSTREYKVNSHTYISTNIHTHTFLDGCCI